MKIPHKAGDGPGKLQIEIFERTGEHTLVQPHLSRMPIPPKCRRLSRRNDADPFITDRWEFFVGGRELANGFSELNDAEDQAQRFQGPGRAQGTRATRKRCTTMPTMWRALEYGMPPRGGTWAWAWTGLVDAVHEFPLDSRCAVIPSHAARVLNRSGEAGIPIGVFDSGVGGLTVLRAPLRSAMPAENFVYLGDNRAAPLRHQERGKTVVRYSLQCAAALIKRRIRALVVACNTAVRVRALAPCVCSTPRFRSSASSNRVRRRRWQRPDRSTLR